MKTLHTWFIAVTLLLFANAAQNALAVPSYILGEIPSQTVWHGGARTLSITGGPFTVSAEPLPKGPIQLASDAASQWIFTYSPHPEDIRPFEVTINGADKSQTFTITPQPNLPPERSVFPTDQHTQPAISTHEVAVTRTFTALPEPLNYVPMCSSKRGLWAKPSKLKPAMRMAPLRRTEIFAETVIIRSPVRWRQTAVTIHARNLIFEGQGKRQTTPDERTQIPQRPRSFWPGWRRWAQSG